MKEVKVSMTVIIALITITICKAQSNTKISLKDFEQLVGSWQGSLTYLDYSTGKPYTMSADIDIKRLKKTNNFIFSNIYPKESSANSIDTVTLSKDRRYIGKEFIKSTKKLANGNNEIITEKLGQDGNDNKPANNKIYLYIWQELV